MFRKIVFWSHLVLGVLGGIFIAIMSFTGAALAFERELIAWAERDARMLAAPSAGATRLPLAELLQRVHAAKPDARINSVGVSNDPRAAVALGLPNNQTLYANPYTAELHEAQAPRMRAFMQSMRAWHTRLNFKPTPGSPPLGADLNAAANVGFVALCLSGVVIWWPRRWTARAVRSSWWFVRGAQGKARDWNWHNVIGIWTLPLLFIMAVTGVVLSYRWAGELVFKLAGDTPPAPMARAPAPPAAGGMAVDAALTRVQTELPQWEQITLRLNPSSSATGATVRSTNQWPPFSATNVTLDANANALKTSDAYGSLGPGLRLRRWIRTLHTGEAFRWPGELVAGLGCLGACVLVWTGLALAWRRFFGKTAEMPATERSL